MIHISLWVYTVISVFLVSLVSLVGIFTVSFGSSFFQKWLLGFVSFSAGTLIGDAFLHLLPEAVDESGFSLLISTCIISGMLVWFIIEKFIHWHHCHHVHDESEPHVHPFAILNLIGDFLHNVLDGMIIAASFIVSVPVGIATTIAVFLHEIPQELSDFGVLVHGGFSKKKALILNFLTALGSVAGGILTLMLAGQIEGLERVLVPFAAGSFIYIATADLIPELHKEVRPKESVKHLCALLAGVLVMVALLFLE